MLGLKLVRKKEYEVLESRSWTLKNIELDYAYLIRRKEEIFNLAQAKLIVKALHNIYIQKIVTNLIFPLLTQLKKNEIAIQTLKEIREKELKKYTEEKTKSISKTREINCKLSTLDIEYLKCLKEKDELFNQNVELNTSLALKNDEISRLKKENANLKNSNTHFKINSLKKKKQLIEMSRNLKKLTDQKFKRDSITAEHLKFENSKIDSTKYKGFKK